MLIRPQEGSLRGEGNRPWRSATFCIFERHTDGAREGHETPKEKGGSVGVAEINQKHLSTLVDRGRGVGTLLSHCQLPSRQCRRSFVSAAALFNGWWDGTFLRAWRLRSLSRTPSLVACSLGMDPLLDLRTVTSFFPYDSFPFPARTDQSSTVHFASLPRMETARLFLSKLQNGIQVKIRVVCVCVCVCVCVSKVQVNC